MSFLSRTTTYGPLDSKLLAYMEWDQNKLVVQFQDGAIYRYDSVPKDTVTAVALSESIGAAFNTMIRPVYKGERLFGPYC